MRITESQLRRIIRQEVRRARRLNEQSHRKNKFLETLSNDDFWFLRQDIGDARTPLQLEDIKAYYEEMKETGGVQVPAGSAPGVLEFVEDLVAELGSDPARERDFLSLTSYDMQNYEKAKAIVQPSKNPMAVDRMEMPWGSDQDWND